MKKALKHTQLLPYKFPFKIYSITKTSEIRTHLICPHCQERIKRPAICPEHGEIKPIKILPTGEILTPKLEKKYFPKMKDFEVIGQTHLAQIPPYHLGPAYYIQTDFLAFITLLMELRKNQIALIVKGSIRRGIKHFVIYAKGQYALLQELIEYDSIEIEPTLPKEKPKVISYKLPTAISIREIKQKEVKV